METERIALSQRERDRLRVLHEVKQKQITQIEAARRLKISDRHIRGLRFRLQEQGDRSVIHGLRGRPSNRRWTARFEQKIVARVRQRYADFGPTAEHSAQEGLPVSRETLRKWMAKASLWRPRSQRVKSIHVGSTFRWFEERGPTCQLIVAIDDATSRLWGRFTERDTTEENSCLEILPINSAFPSRQELVTDITVPVPVYPYHRAGRHAQTYSWHPRLRQDGPRFCVGNARERPLGSRRYLRHLRSGASTGS